MKRNKLLFIVIGVILFLTISLAAYTYISGIENNEYINTTNINLNGNITGVKYIINTLNPIRFKGSVVMENDLILNSPLSDVYISDNLTLNKNSTIAIELLQNTHTHDASNITSGVLSVGRIPSLDASKITSGTFPDERIASASVWNNKLNSDDQRYNETLLVRAVNTSDNFKSFGFNTTSELSQLFYSITNPSGFITNAVDNLVNYYKKSEIDNMLLTKLDITDQRYNESEKINAVNKTENVKSLGFNTTNELELIFYSISNPNGFITKMVNDLVYYYTKSEIDNLLLSKLDITDQRYNETELITRVNTTTNLKSHGFNLTSELSQIFYPLSNPNGFITKTVDDLVYYYTKSETDNLLLQKLSITDQRFNETSLITYVNTTNNIKSLGFNTTNELGNIFLSSAGLQSLNDTIKSVNTTQNIKSLGFNTTNELSSLFYPISNPNNYITNTVDNLLYYYKKTEIDTMMNNKLDITDQRYNESAFVKSVNTTTNIKSLGFNTTSELGNIFLSSAGLQALNDSIKAVNTTTNIKSLGFNTTQELNGLYVSSSSLQALNNTIKEVNTTTNIVNLGFIEKRIAIQRTDVSTSSNTAWSATDLNFAVAPYTNYSLKCNILFSAAAATTGQAINLSASMPAQNVIISYETWSSASAKVGFSATAFGTALVGTGSGANVIYQNFILANFETIASSGTINLWIRSEVSASATTLHRGSFCELIPRR